MYGEDTELGHVRRELFAELSEVGASAAAAAATAAAAAAPARRRRHHRRLPRRPLMVRAALLRRSCDGVAAATEMRRPAPSRSFCASRLDATR